MSDWLADLQRPVTFPRAHLVSPWFARMAKALLTEARLVVRGEPHRLVEVEFYHHGAFHPDVFAHRDPVQVHPGRWYFHRSFGTYRGGSFKGLDITFSDGTTHGGILIRSVEAADGALVVGPSLTVDWLLRKASFMDVPALDREIGTRQIGDEISPLFLHAGPPEERTILRTARVGLSLKRSRPANVEATRFVLAPYRFLTEPRRITKGKVQMVLALHIQGKDPSTIRTMTACPLKTVQRYIADFETGKQAADFGPFFSKDLGPTELCQLHGVWYAIWGPSVT